MKKKQTLPQMYKETPERRKERVREEGARFRSRVEPLKTKYNRKRDKRDMRRDASGGGGYH